MPLTSPYTSTNISTAYFLEERQTLCAACQCTVPFDRLDVWHSCKFSLDVLGNDVDGQEEVDAVRVKPGREGEARFDTVLVAHTNIAETTGLRDM